MLVSVDVDGQPVVVISAHLYPSYYALREPLLRVPAAIGDYADAQQAEARRLVAAAAAYDDVPVFLACDCNTRELNRTKSILSAEFVDATRELGWRIGHSAPSGTKHDQRFDRLDYHWYRGEAEPAGVYRVLDQAGSDHAAIVVDYVFDS